MKDTFCVKCNTHLILTDNISNSPRIKCTNCNTSFNNPHYKKIVLEPKINSTNNEYKQILNFSEKNKSVIIKISIAVSLMFILGIYISRNNNRNDVTVPNYKYNSEENTTNNSYSDNKKTIKFNKSFLKFSQILKSICESF